MALARLDPEVLATLRSKPAAPRKKPRHQRIPLAERAADAQLSRCRVLAEAVTFASKALAHAGSRLQKGAQGFRTAEVGDVPLVEACRGLIQACGGMGSAFTLLAGTMVGDILEPLQDVQRSIEEERARRRAGLNDLEQEEARCEKLQSESLKKRDKVNEELQTQMRERDEVDRRGGWFMRRTLLGKMDRQIERTAQLQSQAVEELARRSHQVAVAKQRTAEGSQELRVMLLEADSKLKKVLQPLLHGCAHAWQELATSIHSIGEKLQVDAESLSALDEAVPDEDTITIDGSEAYWGIDQQTVEGVGTECTETSPTLDISGTISDTPGDNQRVALVECMAPKADVSEFAHSSHVDVTTILATGQHEDPWLGEVLQQKNPIAKSDGLQSGEVLTRPEPAHFRIGGTEDSLSDSSMSYHSSEDGCTDGFAEAGSRNRNEQPRGESCKGSGEERLHALQLRSVKSEVATTQQNTKEPDCIEFVANLPQSPLGLKLTWPPGKVEVLAIVSGGWADLAGIWEGAEIVSVNSERVADMQETELKELLRLRPLHIMVARQKQKIESVAPAVSSSLPSMQVPKGTVTTTSDVPSTSELQAASLRNGGSNAGPTAGAFASHNISGRQPVQVASMLSGGLNSGPTAGAFASHTTSARQPSQVFTDRV